jgi:hypothetical protein
MVERAKNAWLQPRVVLPTLLAILIITAILSPVGQDMTGRYLSTRSHSLNGSHGLRPILDRLGWRTSERLVPFSDSLDASATYVMLNAPIPASAREVHMLLEAVRSGATLIVVAPRAGPITDSIGVRASKPSFLPLRPTVDTLLGRSAGADSAPEPFGYPSARAFHAFLEGTPPTDSDSVGAWPPTAQTLLSVAQKRMHPEIAVLPMSRGEVVAIGDGMFLRNDVLRDIEGAVLAVRMLENVDPSKRRPVIFDEYHQGYGERTTTLGVLADALTGTGWGRAILQLGAAALLYLLLIGVRPIAPTARARYERRSPFEHVSALSRAYETIGASALAVQRLVRGVRRRHPLGTTSRVGDAEYLALLRVRVPALGGDIDTLTNALAGKPTAEQLVAAGAAIDHIERNLIT